LAGLSALEPFVINMQRHAMTKTNKKITCYAFQQLHGMKRPNVAGLQLLSAQVSNASIPPPVTCLTRTTPLQYFLSTPVFHLKIIMDSQPVIRSGQLV
jgi:hypothetical protein